MSCSSCAGDYENPEVTSGDPLDALLHEAYEAQQAQLKVMCAWHPKYFGKPLVMREGPASPVSHGICEECKKRVAA